MKKMYLHICEAGLSKAWFIKLYIRLPASISPRLSVAGSLQIDAAKHLFQALFSDL